MCCFQLKFFILLLSSRCVVYIRKRINISISCRVFINFILFVSRLKSCVLLVFVKSTNLSRKTDGFRPLKHNTHDSMNIKGI